MTKTHLAIMTTSSYETIDIVKLSCNNELTGLFIALNFFLIVVMRLDELVEKK